MMTKIHVPYKKEPEKEGIKKEKKHTRYNTEAMAVGENENVRNMLELYLLKDYVIYIESNLVREKMSDSLCVCSFFISLSPQVHPFMLK